MLERKKTPLSPWIKTKTVSRTGEEWKGIIEDWFVDLLVELGNHRLLEPYVPDTKLSISQAY